MMLHAAQVLDYGLLVSAIASTALACLPNFQPQRKRFGERFAFGFWRFALPAWCFQELMLWLVFHRVYP
jgi:hypothetical protein